LILYYFLNYFLIKLFETRQAQWFNLALLFDSQQILQSRKRGIGSQGYKKERSWIFGKATLGMFVLQYYKKVIIDNYIGLISKITFK
jgi:hypothetical protein